MVKPRPVAPANINPWAKSVEIDLDEHAKTVRSLTTNVAAAIQSSAAVADALGSLASVADSAQEVYSSEITIGTGWSVDPNLPSVLVATPTGRLEIHFSGSVRNGSARLCYSVTDADGIVFAERTFVRDDYAECIPITGAASYPSAGSRMAVVNVSTTAPVTVQFQVWGDTASVILTGANLFVRPAP